MTQIKESIGGVSIAVLVQALITLILTMTVVSLIAMERQPPESIMIVWYVSIGLWMPLPNNVKTP